jgi:predicted aldo/keto reductase-like oxidoreductase
LEANLIELMTSLNRSIIDFYFLDPRASLEDFQLDGALQALETARAEGQVRYLGFSALDNVLSAKLMWTLRDAFEALALRFDEDDPDPGGLLHLARERRVGILTLRPTAGLSYGDCCLVPVSKPEHCASAAKEVGDQR